MLLVEATGHFCFNGKIRQLGDRAHTEEYHDSFEFLRKTSNSLSNNVP